MHTHTANLSMDWEEARVHGIAHGFWKRRALDALELRKETHTMNLDCGLHLSQAWYPILNSNTRPLPPPT